MRLIAHRGFAAAHPENTLRAVTAAVATADAVEVDVRRCGTGELVVIHDETVDRVTDGTGTVADHTLGELQALDVLGTGATIPTLSAVLEAIPDAVGVNVELKESGTAADALATASEIHPNPFVSSFSRSTLAACRDVAPDVPRALLVAESGPSVVEDALELDCEYVHPSVSAATNAFVDAAHREGLAVNAWTVETVSAAEALAERGVDGVIADSADVLSTDSR